MINLNSFRKESEYKMYDAIIIGAGPAGLFNGCVFEEHGIDYKIIEQYLLDAYHRGLEIKIVGCDSFISPFSQIFYLSGTNILEYNKGKRYLFLTIDNKEGLFGKLGSNLKNEDITMLWTKNEEIVFLMKSYIVNNMFLVDIEDNFPEQLRYFYGHGLKKLKDKIL